MAACIDREAMQAQALQGWGQLWPSFMPPEASRRSAQEGLVFDPEQGRTLLDTARWLDFDNDPATPRIAINVPGIPDGTALQVGLWVDETGFQQEMAGILQESLSDCGVGVEIFSLPSQELYAPGPEGPVFGRQFDLALMAWAAGPELGCRLYLDQAIPDEENQWVGTNVAGFAQPDFDGACASASLALEDDQEMLINEAERIFLAQLPSVPLFSLPEVLVFSASLSTNEGLTAGKGFFNQLEVLMDD